jgi:hypothetical protein
MLNFYAALKETEAELLKECLDQLKLSMRQGNVESTKFLLQTRFASQGYGKQSQINMNAKTEAVNVNVNLNVEQEAIRERILQKLQPKNDLRLLETQSNL